MPKTISSDTCSNIFTVILFLRSQYHLVKILQFCKSNQSAVLNTNTFKTQIIVVYLKSVIAWCYV